MNLHHKSEGRRETGSNPSAQWQPRGRKQAPPSSHARWPGAGGRGRRGRRSCPALGGGLVPGCTRCQGRPVLLYTSTVGRNPFFASILIYLFLCFSRIGDPRCQAPGSDCAQSRPPSPVGCGTTPRGRRAARAPEERAAADISRPGLLARRRWVPRREGAQGASAVCHRGKQHAL